MDPQLAIELKSLRISIILSLLQGVPETFLMLRLHQVLMQLMITAVAEISEREN